VRVFAADWRCIEISTPAQATNGVVLTRRDNAPCTVAGVPQLHHHMSLGEFAFPPHFACVLAPEASSGDGMAMCAMGLHQATTAI